MCNVATLIPRSSPSESLRAEPEPAYERPPGECATFGGAIAASSAMRRVFSVLEKVAASDATILMEGESGVGKEVLAQAIHAKSNRRSGPFVVVDCGAIPAQLIESELFGHERGAFTGADRARIGAFEQADGGTIFLDELGELPLELQPKLLRFLETREVRPVGGCAARPVDTRIVAATNRDLAELTKTREFRLDLFYRLAVVRVSLPPLRERPEDILPLATRFLRAQPGRAHDALPADFASLLMTCDWPGNVRELRNVIERYVVLGADALDELECAKLDEPPPSGVRTPLAFHEARRIVLDRFERAYVADLLARSNNVVSRAAELGQISRATLHRMLQRFRMDEQGER